MVEGPVGTGTDEALDGVVDGSGALGLVTAGEPALDASGPDPVPQAANAPTVTITVTTDETTRRARGLADRAIG